MKIKLQRVHFMPKVLEPGVLYVAEEFFSAAHLCPCGCKRKIRTPLSTTDWILTETADDGPSLYPSIGNWQEPCRSHYWIRNGSIEWAEDWTHEEVAGMRQRQSKWFKPRPRRKGFLDSFWQRIKQLGRK